jgi:uncharacterized YigZ family protein
MESKDSYLTIRNEADFELKVRGSKFIGQVRICQDKETAESILDKIRKKYHDATHNCFAYRVGPGNDMIFRYSDDGEPSGTAGKPIYDQIEGNDITNVLAVVTRYFGGTKLGTGGLAHAYSQTARETIQKAGIVEKQITERISMAVQFSDYNNVERVVHQMQARIIDSDFTDIVRITAEIRISMVEAFKARLVDITSGRIQFETQF